MADERTVIEPEVVEPELAVPETAVQVRTQWTKEEVNALVATAHQFPRDMARFHKNMEQTIREMDEKEAEKINYHAPVGGGEFADGESIRCAELVRSNYGHIMIKEDSWSDDKFAYGVCFAWDYQANNATSKKKAYPITYSAKGNRAGGRYPDHLVAKTMMKAQAVARRDAIFELVPKVVYKKYARMAMEKVIGRPEELPHKVNKYLSMLSNIGQIDRQRIIEMLGFATEKDIDSEGLKKLIGIIGAISQGETNMAELFPPPAPPVNQQPGVDGAASRMPGVPAPETTPPLGETIPPADETKAPTSETKAAVDETAPPPAKPKKAKLEFAPKKAKRAFDPIWCGDAACGNVFTDENGELKIHVPCEKITECKKEQV